MKELPTFRHAQNIAHKNKQILEFKTENYKQKNVYA